MADLTDFQPEFGTRLTSLEGELAKEGIGYNIVSGYRSPEYQNRMYQNHLAKLAGQPLPYSNDEAPGVVAPPWRSFHNYGMAADFALKNPADYARLASIAPQFGLTGIGASDPGHIQLGSGSLADVVAQYHLANWRPAGAPAPATGALAYAGPAGTTINASNAPVAGALSSSAASMTNDPRSLVYNKLVAAGLQPHQALGALWSLAGESGKGLDPTSYNPNDPGGSVGIGQWLGPRRAALEAFAKARGTAVTDPNTQADFLVDELTNKDAKTYQPGVFASLQSAKTPEDATRVWTSQFERPEKDNSDARIKGGANVASLDSSGNLVLPGGGRTTAPSGTAVASNAPAPAQDQGWLSKLINPPTDAQGQPIAGAKSPLQELSQASISRLGSESQTERQEAPQQSMGPGPGARNVSPLLANPQVYGQTLNSFSQPLTWNNQAGRLPGMAAAGFQGGMTSQPYGLSLNSLPAAPQGLGYGIPDVGYGFG